MKYSLHIYLCWDLLSQVAETFHSANLQPAAYVANTKFLSVFSWEAA